MISEELATKIRQEIVLKKKLAAIQAEIKSDKQKIKEHMRENELKQLIVHGIKVTYTPPKEYKALYNSKMAYTYLEKHRPDLVVDKIGYESIKMYLE